MFSFHKSSKERRETTKGEKITSRQMWEYFLEDGLERMDGVSINSTEDTWRWDLVCFLRCREHPQSRSTNTRVTRQPPNPQGRSHHSRHVCMPALECVNITDEMEAWPRLLCPLWSLPSLEFDKMLRRNVMHADQEVGSWAVAQAVPLTALKFARRVKFKPCFRADFISNGIASRGVTKALNQHMPLQIFGTNAVWCS